MKQIITKTLLLLCAAATTVSCYRKPIVDDCLCNNALSIPISVDWTKSGITLQNATVLFYNAADGSFAYEHTYEQNSNEIQSYAKLPAGEYTAVVFNELRDQIDHLSCVDYDNIKTLKFECNDDTPLRSRASTRSYIKQSGDLAVATVEDIVVTDEMIVEAAHHEHDDTKSGDLSAETRAAVESLMGIVPLKKNSTINLKAHVRNIYYARMPALVDLVNLSDGYFVYGDKNSTTTATLQFTMNNRKYDETSMYDGVISTSVVSFGTLAKRGDISAHEDKPITLDLLFKMVDTEQTEQSLEMNVTNEIEFTEDENGSVTMDIDVVFDDALTPVKPAESSGESGFGSEVEDWGEPEEVPLS